MKRAKTTHPQILLLRTVRKPMPRPAHPLPDAKNAAKRKRVKRVHP